MGCRFCDNENIIKSGKVRNKQRYHCKSCGKYYINELSIRGYNNQIKLQAIELVTEGVSFRGIARLLKVSLSIVLKWFRNKASIIKQIVNNRSIEEIKEVDVVEIDEMWHYTKKNEGRYGYGLLFLVPQEEYLPLKLALVVRKH